MNNWYALKVFQNKVLQLQETVTRDACEAGEDVSTYVAMTSVDRTVSKGRVTNASASYSGDKMTDVLLSKRAVIRQAGREKQTVTIRKPLIPSLMFVRCSEDFIKALRHNHSGEFAVYTRISGEQRVPAAIPDDQMQTFIWITSEDLDVTYIGEPKDISFGDRVIVTDGPFKGLSGHVKRIKKDRKFVLSIGEIAAFTIEGITYKMMQKI